MRDDQHLIPKGLRAERVSIERGSATISVASVGPSAGCPVCGRPSRRVHSVYERTASDLPWRGGDPPGPRPQVLLRPRVVREADLLRAAAERRGYSRKTRRLEEALRARDRDRAASRGGTLGGTRPGFAG